MEVAGDLEEQAVAVAQEIALSHGPEDLVRDLQELVRVGLVARVALHDVSRGAQDVPVEIMTRADDLRGEAVIEGDTVRQLNAGQPDRLDPENLDQPLVEDRRRQDRMRDLHADAEELCGLLGGHIDDLVVPAEEFLPGLELVGVRPVLEDQVRKIVPDQNNRIDIAVL